MTTAAVEKPSSERPVVRRTYLVRRDQDESIRSMQRRTGDSWSSIVRRVLDKGIAAELEEMSARHVPEASEN